MKKIVTIILSTLFVCALHAQTDVLTFLDIPVDGTESQMREQLMAKGFKKVSGEKFLKGQYDGKEVQVTIFTEAGKVCRLMILDDISDDEKVIKARYNELFTRYANNKNAVMASDVPGYLIPDAEEISTEMLTHQKVYQASFFLDPDSSQVNEDEVKKVTKDVMKQQYTDEQLERLSQERKDDIARSIYNMYLETTTKKHVWFRIVTQSGRFAIFSFFENLNNFPQVQE